MNNSKKNIIKYLIEFLIVAFGVFLGVYVSEWHAQNKTNTNVEKTIVFIMDEIDSNIAKLEWSIDYQLAFMGHVDSIVNILDKNDLEEIYYTNKKFRFDQLPNWKGFGFSDLEGIMYESAKIGGVLPELNIATTKLIARLYQKQEDYGLFSNQVENKMLSFDSKTKVIDVLVLFELLKYDGLGTEKYLLEELKKTKELLADSKRNKAYLQ